MVLREVIRYPIMDIWTHMNPHHEPGGLYPTQLTNPEYSWEVNKKLEAALELGLVNNRIRFDMSWYKNRLFQSTGRVSTSINYWFYFGTGKFSGYRAKYRMGVWPYYP